MIEREGVSLDVSLEGPLCCGKSLIIRPAARLLVFVRLRNEGIQARYSEVFNGVPDA